MARERQFYEDVMDVALRGTLKEYGFKRKSHATYIMDRPEHRWIFELWTEPNLGAGFDAIAGVYVPALEAIFQKFVPDFYPHHAAIRNLAHAMATIPHLMEIAEGHDFYTVGAGFTSKRRPKGYEAAKHPEIMDFRSHGWWVLPKHPMIGKPGFDENEFHRILGEHVEELGHFINEQWRAHVPGWYENCDDPLFLADWIEHQNSNNSTTGCTLGILCHMGGDDARAAGYFRDRIAKAQISYEDLYNGLHKEYRGSWHRQLWLGGGWSEEKVERIARGRFEYHQDAGEAARKLADGLGIAL